MNGAGGLFGPDTASTIGENGVIIFYDTVVLISDLQIFIVILTELGILLQMMF